MNKFISIIIPVRNEIKYIRSCVESVINSDYPKDLVQLLIVDGGSIDGTRGVVAGYVKKYKFIKMLDNKSQTAQTGINIGIQEANGSCLFVIGAHAEYPKNYFSSLAKALFDLGADCVGGVLNTDVKNKSKKSESIKSVLSDIFGVGNSVFRIGSEQIMEVDTVAFGCYRSDVFKKHGLFDERLIRNQDIEFNKRIKNKGAKIYIIPSIVVTYYARDNFIDLAKNNYSNGLWNILTTYYTGTFRSLNLRHFIPLVFVSSVLFPLVLTVFWLKLVYITALSLSAYFIVIFLRSFYLNTKKTSVFYMLVSFFVLHWSYGFGSLMGLFKVFRIKVCNVFR